MELAELRKRIKESITEDMRLRLDASLLPEAGEIIRYIGVDNIELKDTTTDDVDDTFIVTAEALILKVRCVTRLTAHIEDGTARLLLEAAPPSGWRFSDSFSDLPPYWTEEHGTLVSKNAFLGDLTISEPVMIASTYVQDWIAPGLNFSGALHPLGVLKNVQRWLPLPESMTLRGQIQLQPGTWPHINLSASLPDRSFDIGPLVLHKPQIRVCTALLREDNKAETTLELAGYLSGGSANTARFHISAPLLENDRVWMFESEPEDQNVSQQKGLNDLVALLPNLATSITLPEELSELSTLYVHALTFDIRPTDKKVIEIGISIASPQTWQTPIPDVQIGNITLHWFITFPYDPAFFLVSAHLTGTVELGRTTRYGFDVGVDIPDFQLSAELRLGDSISLNDVSASFIPGAAGLPQLEVSDLRFEANLANREFFFGATVDTDWDIPLGADSNLSVSCLQLELVSSVGGLSGMISGDVNVAGTNALLVGNIGQQLILEARFSELNLIAIADRFLGDVSIPPELPDFSFSNVVLSVTPGTGAFSIHGRSSQPWAIGVGEGGLQISDVVIDINRQAVGGGQMALSGLIGGTLTIGGVEFRIDYCFPGDFELKADVPAFNVYSLVESLCGTTLVGDVPVPAKLKQLEVTGVQITVAPQQKLFRLSGQTNMGRAEIMVKRVDGQWGFSVGIAAAPAWQFSQIADELDGLDTLTLSNVALAYSSSADPSFALSTVSVTQATTRIERGLNFFADINLTGLGVSDITGVASLSVYAAISNVPSNLVLQAALQGEFKVAENVYFGNVAFQLRASPAFSVALVGTVRTILDGSPLLFTGGMRVGPRQAVFKITMDGTWKEPFGTEGLEVSDVALDLGMSYPPPVPVIGIAGSLKIRDFEGSVAVKFDSANPARSMVAVAFNQLNLDDVVVALCSNEIEAAIPDELQNTLREIRFENVDLYIAPQPTQIGDRQFEQGLSLEGSLYLSDLRAYTRVKIDRAEGVLVRGELDAIEIGEVFKLTGAEGAANPLLFIEVKKNEVPSVNITGEVELLGMSRATDIHISDDGFRFFTEGNLFDKFACTLEAEGKLTKDSVEFRIVGTLQNDLRQYLRDRAADAIKEVAANATAKITEAQRRIALAQTDLDRLDGLIQARRTAIERNRAAAQARLDQARRNLSSAQSRVDSLAATIRYKEQLCYQLSRKKSCRTFRVWIPTPTWRNIFAGHYEYRTVCLPDANALRQAAALRIELTALYVELGIRKIALSAARTALTVTSRLIDLTPIELDPILLGLYISRDTAKGVLSLADQFLQKLKETIGAVAAIGDYLLTSGTGALIEVRSARFETALSEASGGLISLQLDLMFMGKPRSLALAFNFKDPLSSARELGQKLLPH